MSAVATAPEYTPAAQPLELVTASHAELAEREMYRWMFWFGLPAAFAATFVGAMFYTGESWIMGLVLAAVIGQISMLIWLSMSCDTNSE